MERAPEADCLDRIRQLVQAVEENPFDEDPALELGRSYLEINLYPEAVAVLEGLKSRKPDALELYPLLGISYLNSDRANEAIDHFLVAMSHAPEEGYLHRCMGDALFKAKRYPQALEYYKRSAGMERGNAPLRNMAQAFFDIGRVDDAVEILQEALKHDRTVPELWSSLGWAYIHLGHYHEAVESLKKALDLKPDDIQCLKSLGLAAFALGRKESCFKAYQIVLGLNPLDEEALFGMGILYVSTGDLKCAYRHYETLQSLKSSLCEDLYSKILERKELRMA
jgi:tetratricopeptide (TPR) repeat protein